MGPAASQMRTNPILIVVVLCRLGISLTTAAEPRAHAEGIQCVAASPTGRLLASAGFDRKLRLWDLPAGTERHVINAHKILVSAMAFSPAGDRLATGGWDNAIRVWDVKSGKLTVAFTPQQDLISWLAFGGPDRLISGSRDGSVRLWNLAKQRQEAVWKPFGGSQYRSYKDYEPWNWRHPLNRITAGAVSADRRLVAVSSGKRVKLWDWAQRRVVAGWDGPGEVSQLAFAGEAVLGTCGSQLLRWDRRGKLLGKAETKKQILALAVAGETIAVSHRRSKPAVRFFRLPQLKPAATTAGFRGRVDGMAFAADGKHLFTGDWDCRLRQWRVSDGKPAGAFHRQAGAAPEPKPFRGATNLLPLSRWHGRNELDGVVPGTGEFSFRAKSTWVHQAGRDYAWTRWEPGADRWDFSCRVAIGENIGGNYQGVWIGLSTAPPERQTKTDLTVLLQVSMNGIFGDVRQGKVFELDARGRSRAGAAGAGFSDRGLLRRNKLCATKAGSSVVLQIRRDGNQFLFGAWPGKPAPGQDPLGAIVWDLPEKLGAVQLPCLIIKRIPQKGEQPPVDAWLLTGTITELQARLQPPAIRRILPWQGVLGAGSTVRLQAAGLTPKSRASVGGKPAALKAGDVAGEWRLTLPELPAGQHSVIVQQPNGLWTKRPAAVAVGHLLLAAEPVECAPAGGDPITLRGAGFGPDTRVYFGGSQANVIRVPEAQTLMVKAPAAKPGMTSIRCVTDGVEHAGSVSFGYAAHPYLFFNAEELTALRAACRKAPLAAYRRALLARAEKHNTPPKARKVNKATDTLKVLTWAYALTADRKYGDPLKRWMLAVSESRDVLDFQLMTVGMMAFSYDVMFPELTIAERVKVQRYLRHALATYVREAQSYRWFFTNYSNTCAVGNSGGGLAALALQNADPQAKAAIAFAKHWSKIFADRVMGPDGSCTEGRLYWAYGLGHYLIFADALHRVTGDASLLDHPHLKHNQNFVQAMISGYNEHFLMFNDDYPTVADAAVCALFGARFKQPFMLQIADRYPAKTRMPGFDLLWRSRDAGATPAGPIKLPTLKVLKDIHAGVMRSEGALNPTLTVGLKGSEGPLTHHKHRDCGSFTVQARNERLLVDPGYGAGEHNVVAFGQHGPNRSGAVITDAVERGRLRSAVIDSTLAYAGLAGRVRRSVTMVGDRWVVVVDDIKPLPTTKRPVRLLFHVGEEKQKTKGKGLEVVATEDRRVVIDCRRNRLQMSAFGPVGKLAVKPTSGGKFFASRQQIQVPVTGFEKPVVTVFEIVAKGAATQVPVRRDTNELTIALPAAETLTYKKTATGWGLALDDGVLATAPQHPYPRRSVTCIKTAAAPAIDGKLDDAAWQGAKPAKDFLTGWGWDDKPVRDQSQVRLAWDTKNLYVAIECEQATDQDDFHLLLDNNADGATLFRLVFQADGKVLPEFWGARNRFAATITCRSRVAGGKRVFEVELPWQGFEAPPPRPGTVLRVNFARYRHAGVAKEVSQWASTRGYMDDAAIFYGELRLQPEPE